MSKGRQKRKRMTAIIIAFSMVIGSLVSGAPFKVKAEEESSLFSEHFNLSNTSLGTSAIQRPDNPTDKTDEWQGSYVKFENSAVGIYRVLDPDTTEYSVPDEDGNVAHTMLLDGDCVSGNTPFDADKLPNAGAHKANEWAYSDLRQMLNDDTSEDGFMYGFNEAQRAAIALSTKAKPSLEDGRGYPYFNYAPLKNDRIFVLDAVEATRGSYGYMDMDGESIDSDSLSRVKYKENLYYPRGFWWLRSPYKSAKLTSHVGLVYGLNTEESGGYFATNFSNYKQVGFSPAFNIDLNHVLFTTRSDKKEPYIGQDEWEFGNQYYYLTLRYDKIRISITENEKITLDSNGYHIPFTVTDLDGDDGITPICVSMMIVRKTDTGNKLLSYKMIDDTELQFTDAGEGIRKAVGTGVIDLSMDFYEYKPSTDTVYIMAEQPSDQGTSYASRPLEILKPSVVQELSYTGESFSLVSENTVPDGCTVKYAVTQTSTDEIPTDPAVWSDTVPAGTDAGIYRVWYQMTDGEEIRSGYMDTMICRADTEVVVPTGLTALYGQKLSDVALPAGWTFEDDLATSVGEGGTRYFWAVYKNDGSGNYKDAEEQISIEVGQIDNPAAVDANVSAKTGGEAVELLKHVFLNGAKGKVTFALGGETAGCTLNADTGILKTGNDPGNISVNVTVAEDNNYKALPVQTILVTIAPGFAVTVEQGEGDGVFTAGESVTIKAADAAEGMEFDKWSSQDGVTFADASAQTTTFTMLEKPVTVTALYKKSGKEQASGNTEPAGSSQETRKPEPGTSSYTPDGTDQKQEMTESDNDKAATTAVVKGDVVTDPASKARVKVTNIQGETITAEYIGPSEGKAKNVTIPDKVKVGNTTLSITAVRANAFKNSKATKVTIGANIKKLSAKAFNGSKIKKIVLKTKKLSKKSVKNCLKGCKAKKITISVKIGKKKENKKYVKKYKKYFTGKNAGKKASVK